ncbi:MAG: site-2 protease family protein [Candidatus Sungbacteria bacterium]|nr:site-2 protease family protein [Candidatus Sungbacteria bacterium]
MTILLFIIVLGLVVLVHEWGHFFAARAFGIKVLEFGFGFPPRILGRKIGETLYSMNLIPLGGFVKIYGESGEGEGDTFSFISHPVWHRAVVIVAGVVMNVTLAWILFSVGHIIGIPALAEEGMPVHDARITITNIAPESPAEEAKLAFGNIIREARVGGTAIAPKASAELIDFVKAHMGETLTLIIQSGAGSPPEDVKIVTITARSNPPPGQGPLGIALSDIGTLRSPWYRAPVEGLKTLWVSLAATFDAFLSLVRSAVVQHSIPEGVSGPLGLFALTSQTTRLGISYFIQFVALLSVNLGILNILPFPALDGGRLLFLAIEGIRGKALRMHHERLIHTIGFVLLLLLVIFVSFRDVQRFFL